MRGARKGAAEGCRSVVGIEIANLKSEIGTGPHGPREATTCFILLCSICIDTTLTSSLLLQNTCGIFAAL